MTGEVNSVSNIEKDFPINDGINNANSTQNYKKSSRTIFDYPCHGSRFFNNGKVINGPANIELEKR